MLLDQDIPSIRMFSFSLKLPAFLPPLSATFTSRLTASIAFILFCLILHHFSFDHFDKANLQMQTFLIEQNTVRTPQTSYSSAEAPKVYYYNNENGEMVGDYFEFDDDGEEDFDLYNDENYYM